MPADLSCAHVHKVEATHPRRRPTRYLRRCDKDAFDIARYVPKLKDSVQDVGGTYRRQRQSRHRQTRQSIDGDQRRRPTRRLLAERAAVVADRVHGGRNDLRARRIAMVGNLLATYRAYSDSWASVPKRRWIGKIHSSPIHTMPDAAVGDLVEDIYMYEPDYMEDVDLFVPNEGGKNSTGTDRISIAALLAPELSQLTIGIATPFNGTKQPVVIAENALRSNIANVVRSNPLVGSGISQHSDDVTLDDHFFPTIDQYDITVKHLEFDTLPRFH